MAYPPLINPTRKPQTLFRLRSSIFTSPTAIASLTPSTSLPPTRSLLLEKLGTPGQAIRAGQTKRTTSGNPHRRTNEPRLSSASYFASSPGQGHRLDRRHEASVGALVERRGYQAQGPWRLSDSGVVKIFYAAESNGHVRPTLRSCPANLCGPI